MAKSKSKQVEPRIAAFYASLDSKSKGKKIGVQGTRNVSVYIRVKLLKTTNIGRSLDEAFDYIQPNEGLLNTKFIDPN